MKNLNISKNVVFSVCNVALNAGLLLISLRIIVGYHGLEPVGVWSLLVAWTSFARVGDLGLSVSVVRKISGLSITSEWTQITSIITTSFYSILFISLATMTMAGTVIYFFKDSLFAQINVSYVLTLLPLLLLHSILSVLTSFQSSIIQSFHKGYLSSAMSLMSGLIQASAVWFFAEKYSILSLACGQLISQMFLLIAFFVVLSGFGSFSFVKLKTFDMKILKELFAFGIKVQMLNIVNGYFEPLAKILFGSIHDLPSQGLFEIAYKIVTVSRSIVVAGTAAVFPAVSYLIKNDRIGLKKVYFTYKRRVLLAISVSSACTIMFIPLFSILVLDEINSSLIIMVTLLTLAYYLNGLSSLSYFTAIGFGVLRYNAGFALLSLIALPTVFSLSSFLPDEIRLLGSVVIVLSFCSLFMMRENERLLRS